MAVIPKKERQRWKYLVDGGVLHSIEAVTLGMPIEVWKTRMGRFRNEGNMEALSTIYRRGGIREYWRGLPARLVESATKGAVLLISKEVIMTGLIRSGTSEPIAGFIGGAAGGVCQTSVMAPCTLVVTAVVTDQRQGIGAWQKVMEIYNKNGLRGFYAGGSAVALRQGTNWASRQGFAEIIRDRMKVWIHKDKDAKLTVTQEVTAGLMGGALAVWNQPIEVARIYMQAALNEGKKPKNFFQVISEVTRQEGFLKLYRGVLPRLIGGAYQTMCLVTGPKLIKEYFPW